MQYFIESSWRKSGSKEAYWCTMVRSYRCYERSWWCYKEIQSALDVIANDEEEWANTSRRYCMNFHKKWGKRARIFNFAQGPWNTNPALENFEYHLGSSRVLIVNVMQNIRGMSAMLVVVLIITGWRLAFLTVANNFFFVAIKILLTSLL